MFDIKQQSPGCVCLVGRLDAAQAQRAQKFLDEISGACRLDLAGLEYISSAGLGVLLRCHKRLLADSDGLSLINVNAHIRDIFRYSGFDRVFSIEETAA